MSRDLSKLKMTTGIERAFRHAPGTRVPGVDSQSIYVEVLMHFLIFKDPTTGEIVSQKLEKQVLGQLYKVAELNERTMRSLNGEVEYTFPDGQKKRLIGLGIWPNGQG